MSVTQLQREVLCYRCVGLDPYATDSTTERSTAEDPAWFTDGDLDTKCIGLSAVRDVINLSAKLL
jgi:hypothetical protein